MRPFRPWSRLLHTRDARGPDGVVLALEELAERALLAPVVSGPAGYIAGQTAEDQSFDFSGSAGFRVTDPVQGQTYRATLSSGQGRVAIDAAVAAVAGVGVARNGTGAVTLVGSLGGIDSVLASGVTLTPQAHYSGDASVTVKVTNTASSASGSATGLIHVTPVASDATFSVNAFNEVWAPSGRYAFPPGVFSITNWPDADGSETVTVSFSLDAPDPSAFTLSAGGKVLTPVEPGFWQVSATSQAALRSLLNTLVLTPPAGFNQRVTLSAFANITDSAQYASSEGTDNDSHFIGFGQVALRFFQGGSVTLPPVLGREGGTLDLGGRYVASDPDELEGDTHTLTLSVAGGTLRLNAAAVPDDLSAARAVSRTGRTTITLTGTIDAINRFLATAGCMTYAAAGRTFSGTVPLAVALTNQPGPYFPEGSDLVAAPGFALLAAASSANAPNPFAGVAKLEFSPVAAPVFPSAGNVTTGRDTPAGVAVALTPLQDTDGSESVLVIVSGVPGGASFNHGTNLGGGQWAFSQGDLSGLTFTPPAGATGTYKLTVKAVVTDAAPGLGSDVVTESTTFTITVTSAGTTDTELPPTEGGTDEPTTTPESHTELTEREEDVAGQHPESHDPVRVAFAGYTGGAAPAPPRLVAAPRGAPPGQAGGTFVPGSLPFFPADDRPALPPVLPLDQSLPVAGFSDSGGDSFALIDMIYRGVPATRPPAPKPDAPPARAQEQPAAATTPGAPDDRTTAPPAPGGVNWSPWAAAGLGAAAAVWMRAAGGPNWWPARGTRWLLRALRRRPTEELP
jgi:hypothetical protein